MTTTDSNARCKEEIAKLLGNYEDGWDIFKKAQTWDCPVRIKPESEHKNIPDSWLCLACDVIGIIAGKKYELDTYPNSIKVITAEQMMDAYTTVGMPVTYNHWSFGKMGDKLMQDYERGRMGLAYEIVLNTNPAIVYCMEDNSPTMQMLVLAHAGYGHNSLFKGNEYFRRFTQADMVLDERAHLKKLVEECERKHGKEEVGAFLDSCHALQSYAVDRYKRPPRRSLAEIKAELVRREEQRQRDVDPVMLKLVRPKFDAAAAASRQAALKAGVVPEEQRYNILRFIAENSPHAEDWQREIMLGICEQAQYFYPQRQTQVINEGWASYWHYTLMNDLYDMDLIDDGMMLEFLESHTNVLLQPGVDDRRYGGFNPYALGFAIFKDIERICTNPTEEDREWFPEFAGNGKPLETQKEAMRSCRDDSFIQSYLSPKLMRDFHLFAILDDDRRDKIEVSAIHDEPGYRKVREILAAQYRLSEREPNIEVYSCDQRGDRSLTLVHNMHNRIPLADTTGEVLKHVRALWGGFPVFLHSLDKGKVVKSFACPPNERPQNPPPLAMAA